MAIGELVRLALARLGVSRLRTALTMLGIIIGVGSVVALVSVAQGATGGITSRLTSLGTNLLLVTPGSTVTGFTRNAAGSATTLTIEDANALGKINGVAASEAELSTSALIVAGTKNTTTSVIGTTAGYIDVRTYKVWQGTFLTDTSVEQGLRVAVLGSTTADTLGVGAESIGQQITIGGYPFELIGILQSKGSSDDQVLIPITTVQHYFSSTDKVRTIGISVGQSDDISFVKTSIQSTLEQRHGIAIGGTDDFTITDQSQLLETASSVSGLLTVLLGGIASISLLVGGIGIMNIMLVAVRERTREIGIRKAIGARSRDILMQFLIESLTISLIGGAVGVVLGVAASVLIGVIAGWGFVFNPLTIVAAVAFSVIVGIVFGVWPARQASKLDPVVALRWE